MKRSRLAAPGERHRQRLVFHFVPARADAEPEAVAGENRLFGRLLCHRRRLVLRQHKHAGGELDAAGTDAKSLLLVRSIQSIVNTIWCQ